MRRSLFWLAIFLSPCLAISADFKGRWILEKSEITYAVTHPFHVVRGKSLSARGKGVCYGGRCEFLVAVPVKSFDSKDNNRDLHMLQVTKAALFPLIEVTVEMKENTKKQAPGQVSADIKVKFAGKTLKYPGIKLNILEWKPGGARLGGTLLLSLKGFEIEAPSLLGIPIKDEVPVELDMFWKLVSAKEAKNN